MPWTESPIPLSKVSDIKKATAAVIPAYRMSPEPKIRIPKWNYKQIYQTAEASWIIQTIARVLKQEGVRPGWKRIPKFLSKCKACDAEFQDEIQRCPICDSETRGPSPAQAKLFDDLMNRPNSEASFGDIIKSIIYHDTIADDWYIGILDAKVEKDGKTIVRPAAVVVEDPIYWKPIADEYGKLGIEEYFCPICYKPDNTVNKPGNCPNCGSELERTAYVQTIGSEITARSSASKMIHGSTDRVLPELHGRPKIIDVWDLVHAINYMDQYILDAFSEGHLGGMINFPGHTQESLDALASRIDAQLKKVTVSTVKGVGRTKKSTQTMLVGSEQPIKMVRTMPSLAEMQSLEHYFLYIQAVCGRFGVQPISISFKVSETGTVAPYMQLEVQDRTIREIHRDKEELFNSQLFPAFGITDWLFKFNDVAKKDELREAEIMREKVSTMAVLRGMGFEAYIDEHGKLVIPSKPTAEPTETKPKPAPLGTRRQGLKTSRASETDINVTTTERYPHGTRGEPE